MRRTYFLLLLVTVICTCGPGEPPVPEKAPDENAAIAALQAVNQAQQDFIRRNRRYALTYDELVGAYLLKEAPTVENTGYEITLKPAPDAVSYTILAAPRNLAPEFRHFFTDKTGVIRAETGRPATADSPQI